ncbi:DUF6455 family protein [Tropicimonas sediminicola]|uniref:DUF6455 domain-containing protein n=1 Tax=Tropicimonas sediminicola TaxID=1031541 RepID=A0A239CJ10_9RHOB|nr:DUF6455 family protein [Tropicimonas sediminicola]SNS19333.1 hypothetical protein SAMN05421757_101283 [Tropicimonas sediminicola]
MKPLGPERDHYWMALGMAKAAGVDLQAAIEAGHFSQEKWASTVQKCRGCDWGEDCPSWLREHATVDEAPQACVNARLFATLKAAQDEDARRDGAE